MHQPDGYFGRDSEELGCSDEPLAGNKHKLGECYQVSTSRDGTEKKNHHPDNYMSCIKEIQFDFSLPFNLILNLMLNAAFY